MKTTRLEWLTTQVSGFWLLLSAELQLLRYRARLHAVMRRIARRRAKLEDLWEKWDLVRDRQAREEIRLELRDQEVKLQELAQPVSEVSAKLTATERLIRLYWRKLFQRENQRS
jgi:hypothetical protein